MNNIIDNFVDQNEKIIKFLDDIGRDYENADKNLQLFKDYLTATNYNMALGVDFANVLQNLNKKENFADFELSAISRLFSSLIKTEEFNIDIYFEASHFEWAINNRHKAIEIIHQGLVKAEQKTNELKSLLDIIQKGSET